MSRLPAWLLCLVALLPASAEPGLRLLMFDADDCEFCARWEQEIGVVYERTAEGRRAPLRRVPLEGTMPEGFALQTEVRYTPTFVLLEGAREVGRITGYPGEHHFWGLLGEMLAARRGEHIQP